MIRSLMDERRQKPAKDKGFTLTDMMLAASVMAIVAVAILPKILRSTDVPEVRGVAEVLAAELREAQALARSAQQPVALVFPTDNGSTSSSRSFYRLEGWHKPRITKVTTLPDNAQDIFYFVGTYDSTPATVMGKVRDPGLKIDLENWSPPHRKDLHFIFSPSGTVHTNGLGKIDGNYHIVVAKGLLASGGSPPPGVSEVSWAASQQKLTDVGPAQTVVVSETGAITTQNRVAYETSITDHIEPPGAPTAATPPSRTADPTLDPTAVDIRITPDPSTLALPPGADALISEDGELTIELWADSPEGVPLHCQWTCADGAWTSQDTLPMTWDEAKGAWKSVWTWAPDPGTGGSTFELNCDIRDDFGHSAPNNAFTSIDLPVTIAPDRFALISNRAGGAMDVYTMRTDGTDIVHIGDGRWPNVRAIPSPDGSKVVVESDRNGNLDLYLYSSDGSFIGQLTNDPAQDFGGMWSCDGTKIIFHSTRTGSVKVHAMDARPGAPQIDLAPSLPYSETRGCSPDSEKILLFTAGPTGDLYVTDIKPTGPPGPPRQLTSDPGSERDGHFHPTDNDRYNYGSDRSGSPRIYEARFSDPPGVYTEMAPGIDSMIGCWDSSGKLWIIDVTKRLFEDGVATPILNDIKGLARCRGGGMFVIDGALGSQEGYVVHSAADVRNVTNSPSDDQIIAAPGY